MNPLAVRVAGLRFGYGPVPVLEDLCLDVAHGEIFGIVGADGAGKSTLLKLLIGQLAPAAGRIEVLGDAGGTGSALRERIAYMPQSFGQYLDLSVQENLAFFAALHGLRGADAAGLIADLVARAGLQGFEDRRAGQLSGGMMQKLALACALVSRPEAMFLDEPTTGVDPVSRRAFWQLLEGVCAEGVAIVCTTANMDEAERCHRVASLEGGRLVREGRPAALIAQAGAQLCVAHGAQARAGAAALAAAEGVALAFPVGREVRLWLEPGCTLAALDARLAGRHGRIEPATPSLHDLALRELALAERARRHG
ncbi:ABC transporter ATP-binding protein [Aquabacterium sp.]|uniref:ABC transporter ATP-binding protein n=1 Tax=Aquabacterium sp. TaxID=1872578 RepID=UPI00378330E3